jgi:2-polyprenyl-3-methyl-5-hydroxy-6-metoxy-1,4-benzoquinol methylase
MMKCVLCENKSMTIITKKVRDASKNKVIKCKKCAHTQLYPIPLRNEDQKFYDNNLQEKNQKHSNSLKDHREKSRIDTKRRIDFVSKICKKKDKILEIGSGYGFFLEGMKEKGFNITGLEVSKERRKISKKVTKAEILNINLMDENLEIGKFDVIVFFHVLEHISDSVNFLKNLKKILNKKGKIIIEVPNYDDFQINLNLAYKNWHFQRAHIHYFTSKTLKKTIQKSGFKNISVTGIQRYGIGNMFNWKINNKPQLKSPEFEFKDKYQWIDKNYKIYLEKNLISDTIIAVVSQ